MRILLVDDEQELLTPLSRSLAREGYAIDTAGDGRSAASLVTSQQYDLLIFDWMLPEISGIDLCRQVRSRGDDTPVLLLTAKDTIDDRVTGLDAGADDYLVKPFELRELLARVRALLRRSRPLTENLAETLAAPEETGSTVPEARSNPAHGVADRDGFTTRSIPNHQPRPGQHPRQRLVCDDLELDCDNQLAYRGGRIIELSEKEACLLAYLMGQPGQLLGHEEIAACLWPGGDRPSSNALAAQIRLLRRKIEAIGEVPLIHSVYGKGYRFGLLQSP